MRGDGRNNRGRGRGRGSWRGPPRGQRWNGGSRGHRGGGGGPRGPPAAGHRDVQRFSHQVGPRLAETDVGITEFTGKHEGFSAVIKHRFSDFQVNEIDCDGNIVKFTSLEVPPNVGSSSTTVERHELIPKEIWDKISSLTKKTESPSVTEKITPKTQSSAQSNTDSSEKQVRNDVSESASPAQSADETKSIPETSPQKTDSTPATEKIIPTTQSSDQSVTSPLKYDTNSGEKQIKNDVCESASPTPSADKTKSMPETSPQNPPNKVASTNPDSNDVVQQVELDVTLLDKESRRAIHNSVKGAFKQINSNTVEKDGKKIVVFHLSKGTRGENRGQWPTTRGGEYLYFVVHKRNMDTTEVINTISQKLWMKANNITFAGTKDRRGITSQLMAIRRGEPTRLFKIGKYIPGLFIGNYCFKEKPLRLGDLKGNQFRIALRNVQGSDEEVNAGLESLKNNGFINYYGLQRFGTNKAVPTHSVGKALLLGDWQKAIDLILEPREGIHTTEAALKEWKSSRNAGEALKKLQGRSNGIEELLLTGITKYGPNDFVNALGMIPLNTRLMYLHAYQSLIWNKSVSRRISEFGLNPIAGDLILVKSEKVTDVDQSGTADNPVLLDSEEVVIEETRTRQEVRCITEEEINNFSINDIVLPLPGYEVVYPKNSIGSFMTQLLKEDGLTSESLQQQVRTYSVKGTYRHIVAKADKLSWNIVNYNDPGADLIASDYDEMMKGKKLDTVKEGKYKALVISMCLEPSTYATMALREITRKDTSATTQASIAAEANAPTAPQSKNGGSEKEEVKTSSNEEKVDDSADSEPCLQALKPSSDDGNANESAAAELPVSIDNSKNLLTESTSDSNEQIMQVSDETAEQVVTAVTIAETDKMSVEDNEGGESGSGLKRKASELLDEPIAEKKSKET